jgi:hypothetical protein
MTKIMQQNKNISIENNPVLQVKKHKQKSEKYQFISSDNIGKFFENEGFTLDGVSYANSRNEDKKGYQKHLMLFSRPDLLIDGDNKLQLLVQNSHDGSSALKINTGVYRAICANGLVSGNDLYSQTVRHIGKSINEQLKESLYYILGHMTSLKNEVETMKKTRLNFNESQRYMKNVVDARFKEIKNIDSIDLSTVDRVRRYQDNENDLFTFFNRCQESIIKGGVKYKTKHDRLDQYNNVIGIKYKNHTSRQITNIKKSIDLNKILWSEAVKLTA